MDLRSTKGIRLLLSVIAAMGIACGDGEEGPVLRVRSLRDRGDLRGARALLEGWLRTHGGDDEAKMLLASVLLQQGATEKVSDLLRHVDAKKAVPEGRAVRLATLFVRAGDLERAAAVASMQRTADPDALDARFVLVSARIGQGRCVEAEKELEELVRREPTCAKGHFILGTLREQRGALAEARDALRRCLLVDDAHGEAQHLLGVVEVSLGLHESAAERFSKAIRLRPHLAGSHYGLAYALVGAGRRLEAIEALRRTLALDPAHGEAEALLVRQLGLEGRWDEVVPILENLRRRRELDGGEWLALGRGRQALGDDEGAFRAYESCLEVDPTHAEAWNNLGILHGRASRWDEADLCYDRALKLEPWMASAMVNRGILARQRGRLDEALAWYERARAVRDDDGELHYNVGVVLALGGRGAEAEAAFRRALELSPHHGGALYNLAVFALRAGRMKDATRLCREARQAGADVTRLAMTMRRAEGPAR